MVEQGITGPASGRGMPQAVSAGQSERTLQQAKSLQSTKELPLLSQPSLQSATVSSVGVVVHIMPRSGRARSVGTGPASVMRGESRTQAAAIESATKSAKRKLEAVDDMAVLPGRAARRAGIAAGREPRKERG
jgi:hypothetical protein